jgi:hypothetical protein
MRYLILHIPTGTYYSGILSSPVFADFPLYMVQTYPDILDAEYCLARILKYVRKLNGITVRINDKPSWITDICENEFEIIEDKNV